MAAYALQVPDPQTVRPDVELVVRSFAVVLATTGRQIGAVTLTEQGGFRASPSGQTCWTLDQAVADVLALFDAMQGGGDDPEPVDRCGECGARRGGHYSRCPLNPAGAVGSR